MSALVDVYGTANGTVLRNSLALAGVSGTLAGRMLASRADGDCRAKTGTLNEVSNLAGYCRATDGDTLAFAVFLDGTQVGLAHRIQDNLAITLADFRGVR